MVGSFKVNLVPCMKVRIVQGDEMVFMCNQAELPELSSAELPVKTQRSFKG